MSAKSAAVIVVTGLPCTGKSTLASELRKRTGWPLLAKDLLKETLFATLGIRDRDWSRRLSVASYALMFSMADELLASGHALIMEGNFRVADHSGSFTQMLARRSVPSVQIFCSATPAVLMTRLAHRATRNLRHPGHADQEVEAEIRTEIQSGSFLPLPLSGPLFEWDSSQPDAAQLSTLLGKVIDAVSGYRPHPHPSDQSDGE